MHVDVQFRSDNGTCLWLYIAVAHCFWSYFSLLDFILEFNFYLDFNFYFGYMQNNLCWIIWMYSAYSRISANWYNKKLVTVKYILLERYHKRFPRSASSNTILAWKKFYWQPKSQLSFWIALTFILPTCCTLHVKPMWYAFSRSIPYFEDFLKKYRGVQFTERFKYFVQFLFSRFKNYMEYSLIAFKTFGFISCSTWKRSNRGNQEVSPVGESVSLL